MLKKLRRKFILINMLLVGAVLLCVFVAVCTSSYQSLTSDVSRSLQMAVELPGGRGDKPDGMAEKESRFEKEDKKVPPGAKYIAIYSVLAGSDGKILHIYQPNPSIDEDTLTQAVGMILEEKAADGQLTGLHLTYKKREMPDGTVVVALADSHYVTASLQQMLLSCLLIGAGGLVAFFTISLFLSRWALRPVEEAWQRQRQFVADASHELKTPLTVILANQNILKSHVQDTVASQQKWIDSTGEEAQHMRRLVDDLLFLAKADADMEQRQQAHGNVDISELVWNVVLQFEPVAYEKEVSLQTDIQPGLHMAGDMTQLRQLVHILLDNACKYAGIDGRGGRTAGVVYLRLEAVLPDYVRLTVRNTGVPIPKEEIPHIFERFYRSDKARSREGGFGLGLAIAKSIADSHHGNITVQSDAQNGTIFMVTFKSI